MHIKRDKLDILFSEYIRKRAGGKCEYCRIPKDFKQLQCSHYWGRRKKSVRWDESNAAGICFSCHRHLTEHPYVHTEWFKKRLGEKEFLKLNIRANMTYKPDRKMIEMYLKEKLKYFKQLTSW